MQATLIPLAHSYFPLTASRLIDRFSVKVEVRPDHMFSDYFLIYFDPIFYHSKLITIVSKHIILHMIIKFYSSISP